jgi:hypothetical protein
LVESNAGPVTPPADASDKAAPEIAAMSAYKSDFLNILAERGFIHQVSEPEALDARAKAGAITAYIGFDCTAASLHIGSLLPIIGRSRSWAAVQPASATHPARTKAGAS